MSSCPSRSGSPACTTRVASFSSVLSVRRSPGTEARSFHVFGTMGRSSSTHFANLGS